MKNLPDVQAEEIDSIPLTVGVQGVKKYVTIQRNKRYDFPVRICATVKLPGNVRGGNLSRFQDSVLEVPSKVSSLEELAYKLATANTKRHKLNSTVSVSAEMPLKMMWNGTKETQMFPVTIKYEGLTNRLTYEITLLGMANCPCAKACSDSGISHNQNSELVVAFQVPYFVCKKIDIGDIVKGLTGAFSAPVRYRLKRDTEAKLVQEASDNSKFVEDIARDAHDILRKLVGGLHSNIYAKITVINYESIHPHNVFARWEGWLRYTLYL